MPSDYTDLDISTFVMLFLKIYDFEPHYRYIENLRITIKLVICKKSTLN